MGMTGEQAYVLAKKLIEAGGGGGGTVDAYTKTQTDNLLMQKVDKEVGKGLFSGSYNDLSDKPTIPSKTSELQNDSGYLTEHQDLTGYAKKDEIPTVPSKVSELTNDSNYQTAEQVNSTVTTEIAKIVADAPEDLNTLKEMSDWIAGHEKDASAMNSAISDNKTAITALQTGKADKSEIPKTLPANGGNSDTVNNHTVETDVPTDAVFTDTIYDDTEVKESISLQSTEILDIKMLGWTVPKEMPIKNYVDSDGVFHQRVGRVCLIDYEWSYSSSDGQPCFSIIGTVSDCKGSSDWRNSVANGYCNGYRMTSWNNNRTNADYDMSIAISPDGAPSVRNSTCTDVQSFKQAMKGVYLYYELKEENLIKVDGNEAVTKVKNDLCGLTFSASGTTLSITDGTNTWTLEANS